MKTILAIFILVLILAVGGYFALPILIEKGTAGIKAETGELKQRLERIEGFVKSEEEARRNLRIEPGADAAAVLRGSMRSRPGWVPWIQRSEGIRPP